MKPIIANLKTLYQCKKLWLAHLMLIGFYFGLGTSKELGDLDIIAITAFAFIHFCYGWTIGALISDIFGKPFSYCLPGQKKSAQLMAFLIWLSMIVIFTLISGSFSEGPKSGHNFSLISTGLLSLSYWLGVALISRIGLFIFVFYLLAIILFPILHAMELANPASMLLAHPDTVFLICIILSFLLYRSVGRIEYVRRMCMLGILRVEGIRLNKKERPDWIMKGLSDFFSGRIKSSQTTPFLSHIWAQIYLIAGPFITNPLGMLIILIIFGFWFFMSFTVAKQVPFFDDFMNSIFIILLSSCFFNYHRFNPFLLTGRREYFWKGITILFISISAPLLLMISSIIIFFFISGSLPHINWVHLISPVIAIPFIGAFIILLDKNNRGLLMFSMVSTIVVASGLSYWGTIALRDTSLIFNSMVILNSAVITWGFHVVVLRYDSMKRPLC